MPKQTTHPSREELSAYSLGQLPLERAVVIDSHISECQPCCETIVGLSSDDTFVGLLQEAKQLPTDQTVDLDGSPTKPSSSSHDIPAPLAEHPRYEIVGLIGKGGMGDVYRARHRMMDRTVAVKIINCELVRKPEAVDRFHREVKTAAQLSHPNIVTSHDAEQAGDLHFLVMEYVDGVDLSHIIKDRGALPIAEACDYIRQAAIGLQHAHQQGMVHRDIKPHNLMVTADGTVKILDFGLASLAPEAVPDADVVEARSDLTAAGAIMGTPDFISPEQADDARQADIRSDIYSLGTTLYFLLSGRPPFTDGSVMHKLKSHAQAEPEPLESLRDDIPADLAAIVTRMTAKNPDERFQTPAEVAAALKSFSHASQPAQEKSPRPQVQPRRERSRILKLTAVATLFVAAILAGIVYYIQTNTGTVRVEVTHPSMEVTISGQTITMKEGNKQPLTIRAGQQKLVVRQGDSDLEFETDNFEIRRNDKIAFKVERLEGEVVVTKNGMRIGAAGIPHQETTVRGWIDSPLAGKRRSLGDESSLGVEWFLREMEGYSGSGRKPNGPPVAELTYKGAIRVSLYGTEVSVDDSALDFLKKRLDERPHLYRLDAVANSMTIYNQVHIEKVAPAPILKRIEPGQSFTANVGNMPCDLILDALTIPFAIGPAEQSSYATVDPRILLPHLGEQYGAGILSKAVSWRLVDRGKSWPAGRGMSWPAGEDGESANVEVAELLQRQCLESPRHLSHGWCLRDLRKLAKNARSAKVTAILEAVESQIEGEPPRLKTDLSPQQILDRMAEAYTECKSYRDSGVVKTVFDKNTVSPKRTVEKPFTTVFVRPDRFRFEFKDNNHRYLIWANGQNVQTWWDVQPGIQKPKSLQLAVGGATGVSGGSASRVPAMLMPGKLEGWGGVHISDAKRLEDGKLENVECFRLEGKALAGDPITLWIDKQSYLVRRIDEQVKFDDFRTETTTTYDPTIDGKITDKMLEFDPPGTPGQEKTSAATLIKNLELALNLYKLDNGTYPSTEEGLRALVQKPADKKRAENWAGPYLKELPLDPWGNEFEYAFSGTRGGDATKPDIWSRGPDGKENTDDDIGTGSGDSIRLIESEMLREALLNAVVEQVQREDSEFDPQKADHLNKLKKEVKDGFVDRRRRYDPTFLMVTATTEKMLKDGKPVPDAPERIAEAERAIDELKIRFNDPEKELVELWQLRRKAGTTSQVGPYGDVVQELTPVLTELLAHFLASEVAEHRASERVESEVLKNELIRVVVEHWKEQGRDPDPNEVRGRVEKATVEFRPREEGGMAPEYEFLIVSLASEMKLKEGNPIHDADLPSETIPSEKFPASRRIAMAETELRKKRVTPHVMVSSLLQRHKALTLGPVRTELLAHLLIAYIYQRHAPEGAPRPDRWFSVDDKSPSPATTEKNLNAGQIIQRLTKKHGHLVPKLQKMFSEAAGIPNAQWHKFAADPKGSPDAIQGEPLSLLLWKLNPLEASKTNLLVLRDFQYIGGIPKPKQLSDAMFPSQVHGYYSMIQPHYISGLGFDLKRGTNQLKGNFRFQAPNLYAGKIDYVVEIVGDDLHVVEFTLPNYGITIVRDDDGLWKRKHRIAFAVDQRRQSGIHVIHTDGSGLRQLTNDPFGISPSWSPDGQQIAFLTLRAEDHELNAAHDLAFHFFLYVMDADGRNQHRVTKTPIGSRFQWSPDGNKFLFESSWEDSSNKGKDGTHSSAIYVMKSDGTQQQRLTPIEKSDGFPSWSPDGKRIAFCSDRGGNQDIYVMNADGSGVRRLTDDEAGDTDPVWSPDGSQIAFTSFRMHPGGSVCLVRADGSDEKLICDNGWAVGWSPDSGRILITKDGQLATVDAVGQQETSLTKPGTKALDAAFTSDGRTIFYRTKGSDGWEIRSVSVNGGEPQRIIGDVGNISGFCLWTQRAKDNTDGDSRSWEPSKDAVNAPEKFEGTRQIIKALDQALDIYKLDNGTYPSTDEGLKALVQKPTDEARAKNWGGPYLKELPTDPWGNAYAYQFPGKRGGDAAKPDIWSRGPDGKDNTEDDIRNWITAGQDEGVRPTVGKTQ